MEEWKQALEALVSEQNGPPLMRRKQQWLLAMKRAHELLENDTAVRWYSEQLAQEKPNVGMPDNMRT